MLVGFKALMGQRQADQGDIRSCPKSGGASQGGLKVERLASRLGLRFGVKGPSPEPGGFRV